MKNNHHVSPVTWTLYGLYCCIMFLVATDFAPLYSKPSAKFEVNERKINFESRMYAIKMNVTNVQRELLVFLPTAVDTHKSLALPLLVCLHSMQRSGWFAALKETEWVALAEEHKFIVIFPQSRGQSPDAKWGSSEARWTSSLEDTEFIASSIRHMVSAYDVNLARIYISGSGNGGFFGTDLVIRFPKVFGGAHIAMGGLGRFRPQLSDGDSLTKPTPLFFSVGDQDSLLPKSREAEEVFRKAGHETRFVTLAQTAHLYKPYIEKQVWFWFSAAFRPTFTKQDIFSALDFGMKSLIPATTP